MQVAVPGQKEKIRIISISLFRYSSRRPPEVPALNLSMGISVI